MVHHGDMLPSQQHRYDDLPELSPRQLHDRREGVFLLLAGLFLGTLAMLNILGISRFIHLWTIETGSGFRAVFAVAVGVLPYPMTFLCTDFISELYGKKRASLVVWIGLILNIWVVFILWVGGALPGFESVDESGAIARDAAGRLPVFFEIRALAFGAVTASMIAYLIAQLVDVHVFHFWKKLTRGRYLWVRNNGSTLVSQLVDTVAVILITYYLTRPPDFPVDESRAVLPQLMVLIFTGYAFKFVMALVDTVPFYLGSKWLSRYLRLPPPGQGHPPEKSENVASL
ncbi:MAG: queuosine precursor transporter [Phycisphaerales bacterium JB058]